MADLAYDEEVKLLKEIKDTVFFLVCIRSSSGCF